MALILVLLIICITLGLSYAAVRSQFTGLKIQQNADRRISARQAAATGLTMAIKKMHKGDEWAGVGTSISGSLNAQETYKVTYKAGHPALDEPEEPDTWDDPDFDDPYYDYAYRVTLDSTGRAEDPTNPESVAEYRIRAVVRLVPQRLEDEPTDWETMQEYTVYQTHVDPFEVDLPCRLEGLVLIQGKLKLAPHYPVVSGDKEEYGPWRRYLNDLLLMHTQSGRPDYRPFNGPVHFSSNGASQDPLHVEGLALLNVHHAPADIGPVGGDWEKPTALTRYQVYPGGPVYEIPLLGSTLETSRGPDPQTNPLGLFYRDGSITIQDGVTICGTLFCKDDIHIAGNNVDFKPVAMPPRHDLSGLMRLPVATCKNFYVEKTATGSLTGLLAAFDHFEVRRGPETTAFAVTGRVVASKFSTKEREEWITPDGGYTWEQRLAYFNWLRETFPALTPEYFPEWMETKGRDPRPLLTVVPDPNEPTITYHWKKWYNPDDPVYMLAPNDPDDLDDDGLHWELLEWTENPP